MKNERLELFNYNPQDHPERLVGETFVGNTNFPVEEHLKNCNGVRIGEQAYDIYGLPLESYLRPIFTIGSSYSIMMNKRFSDAKNGIKKVYKETYNKNLSFM